MCVFLILTSVSYAIAKTVHTEQASCHLTSLCVEPQNPNPTGQVTTVYHPGALNEPVTLVPYPVYEWTPPECALHS